MKKIISLLLLIVFTQILNNRFYSQGFNDSLDLQIEDKISIILEQLSLEEKIGQTCQITLDVILQVNDQGSVICPHEIDTIKLNEAINIYKIGSILNVSSHSLFLEEWKSLLKSIHSVSNARNNNIPIIYGIDAIHGMNYTNGSTLFPQEIGLAATWNPGYAQRLGEITAYEMRASGIPWNFSPVLDVARQPLWSRYFETFGEDPFLSSSLGKALVFGYQGDGVIDRYHGAACLKHFVGYSQPLSGRDRTPAWIPEKYLQELFLPPFKTAVESGAMTVMVNSGDVNGIPGHVNAHLLKDVLKGEWGFNGFTVSDWEDFIMLETVHSVSSNAEDAIVMAFNSGVDMSMVPLSPNYKIYCDLMLKAVQSGRITQERLDDAVRRILRVKFALGLFNTDMNQAKFYPRFGSADHISAALETAQESITLLKNRNHLLPLSKDQKILVAGPTSNSMKFLNGAWTHTWQGNDSIYNSKNALTIYQAISKEVGEGNCLFAQGAKLYFENGFETSRLIEIADFKEKVGLSDIIVLCLGELPQTEKPGDIHSLNLSEAQLELAKIAFTYNKPVILILTEARPRIIHSIVDSSAAIVQCYVPGDYGGQALADILFGKVNPSGKLPYTYPKYDGVIEFYDHPKSVDRSKNNDFNAFDPEWEFGFGMSYTTFDYSNLVLSSNEITESDELTVSVTLKNTGNFIGQEVVQLFVSDQVCSLVPASKKLKGFEKITLKPNESRIVQFTISKKDLIFSDATGNWKLEPGLFSIKIANLETSFTLK
jgi:beta-glucosidase